MKTVLATLFVAAFTLALANGAAVPLGMQEARASRDDMVPVANGHIAGFHANAENEAQRYVTAEELDTKLEEKFAELKEFLKGNQEVRGNEVESNGAGSDGQAEKAVCDCYLRLMDTAEYQWYCSNDDCYDAMVASIASEVESDILKAKEQTYPDCSSELHTTLNLDPNLMRCDCHYCIDSSNELPVLVFRCISDNPNYICTSAPSNPAPSPRGDSRPTFEPPEPYKTARSASVDQREVFLGKLEANLNAITSKQ